MSKINIEDGYKETPPTGSIIFAKNKLVVPGNISVGGLELVVQYHLAADAADNNGLDATNQKLLLNYPKVTFRENVSAGNNAITPINEQSFYQLLHDAWGSLERDAIGGVASTTGLQKALVEGANILEVTIPISLAQHEAIKESGQVCGLGPAQLMDSELKVAFAGDPTTDTNVTLTKVGIYFRVIEAEDSEGDREGIPLSVMTVKGGAENKVDGPDGLTFRVEHVNEDSDEEPLSGTDIEKITVTVGPNVVANDPATVDDIQAAYEREPTTGTVEKLLKTVRVPLYVVPETPLSKLMPGVVSVKMASHYEDLVARVLYYPLLSHNQVMERIIRRAKMLEDGQELHAVNTAIVENLGDSVNAEQLPFCGWEYFTSEDPRFHQLPGLRCRKGRRPRIFLPLKDLIAGSTAYSIALADTGGDANSAAGAATAVVFQYGKGLPGLITASQGLVKGGASPIFLGLRNLLANGKAEVMARTRPMSEKDREAMERAAELQ